MATQGNLVAPVPAGAEFAPLLPGRRAFLVSGCSAAALIALGGCETGLPGEFASLKTLPGGPVDFDLKQAAWAPLKTVGGWMAVDSGSTAMLLIRTEEKQVVALGRICPHQAADMAPDQNGKYDPASRTLTCTKHTSRFNLSGTCIDGAALGQALRTYAVDFDGVKGTVHS